MQIAEDVRERERVLRPERQQQRILGGRRLQLEVELAAEPLAQRQPPRLVDAAAERRVQHELHAARFVEEPLEHERLLCRHHAECAAAFGEIVDRLLRGAGSSPVSDAAAIRSRVACVGAASRSPHAAASDVGAQIADRARQLVAPRRRFAEPERHRSAAHPSHRRRAPFRRRPAARARRRCRAERRRRPMLSMAKSSFSVPMNVSSGSSTTR